MSGRPGDVIQVPRLEPKDLYDRRIRRDYARLRAYNTLLEQIYHKIYATSQLPGNNSSVTFTIPPFILGLPKLDMEDCVVYLVWQLRDSKFEVRFTWPNFLWISWRHHEAEYLAKQNPIIQAMVPDVPPPAPKAAGGGRGKKGGGAGAQPAGPAPPSRPTVAFNQEIELITNMPAGGSPFGAPPPRHAGAAAEYMPPSAFVQTMDRPIKPPGSGPGPGPAFKEGAKGNVLADLWAI